MDLNNTTPGGILPPITSYNFDSFDDEVSKGSGELTVDSGFTGGADHLAHTSALSNQELVDINQVQLMEQDSHLPVDTTEQSEKKKGGFPKGKKRKRAKDVNAPKQPLTGYVRFLNDHRDRIRAENPGCTFSEITKILGADWSKLNTQEKQRYLDDAEKDKERYLRELNAYHKTEAYKVFLKKQNDIKRDGDNTTSVNGPNGDDRGSRDGEDISSFDIPIFTEEFLDHNKSRETELRLLRKQNTEYEEQNAILSKHIEKMKAAIDKLEVEAVQQRTSNLALHQHLATLRATLSAGFSSLPLPGSSEVATVDTVDSYMARLHAIILESPADNEDLITAARDIVTRLNFDSEKL